MSGRRRDARRRNRGKRRVGTVRAFFFFQAALGRVRVHGHRLKGKL
jgi:hypothetical protein